MSFKGRTVLMSVIILRHFRFFLRCEIPCFLRRLFYLLWRYILGFQTLSVFLQGCSKEYLVVVVLELGRSGAEQSSVQLDEINELGNKRIDVLQVSLIYSICEGLIKARRQFEFLVFSSELDVKNIVEVVIVLEERVKLDLFELLEEHD